jgi:hypothetical protein
MKTNFYPLRYFQSGAAGAAGGLGAAGTPAGAAGAAIGATGPVGIGLAAAQTALGIVQAISGGQKTKRLLARRRAYQTPEEIFKLLNAVESRADEGYDPATLSYITGQADRAFSSSVEAATRLGGDPNLLSQLLDQRIQATFRIGAENQLLNMKNFEKYINALELLSANKAAEQKSQQDLIKDQLQAASAQQQAGLQNIGFGANTALSTLSSMETQNLYR